MRRPIMIAAIAVTFLVAAPIASSYAAAGHDQVTGTGRLGQFGNPTAHVNGVRTNAGLKGGFTITYPDGTSVTGTVTCLAVTAKTAYATGKITAFSGPRQAVNGWSPGNYLVIGVQDNGSPGTAGPDMLNFSPGFPVDPGCGPNGEATPVFAIVDGNYRVVDAS